MARVTENNNTSTNGKDTPKPVHYVNFKDRETNEETGYRIIDKLSAVDIAIAQKSPEACDKRYGNEYELAYYRQAGVSNKPKSTRSVDDF